MSKASQSVKKDDSKDPQPALTFPMNIPAGIWTEIFDRFEEPCIVLGKLPLVCKHFCKICLDFTTWNSTPMGNIQEATEQAKDIVNTLQSYLYVRRDVRKFQVGTGDAGPICIDVPNLICIDVFTKYPQPEIKLRQSYAMVIRPAPYKDLSPGLKLLRDKSNADFWPFVHSLADYRKVVRFFNGEGPTMTNHELNEILDNPEYKKFGPYFEEHENHPTTNPRLCTRYASQFLKSLVSNGFPASLKALMVRDMYVHYGLMDSIDYIELDTFHAKNIDILSSIHFERPRQDNKILFTFPNAKRLRIPALATGDDPLALAGKTEELVVCFPIRSGKSVSTRIDASHCVSLKRM
jgi:hypothetical protein